MLFTSLVSLSPVSTPLFSDPYLFHRWLSVSQGPLTQFVAHVFAGSNRPFEQHYLRVSCSLHARLIVRLLPASALAITPGRVVAYADTSIPVDIQAWV